MCKDGTFSGIEVADEATRVADVVITELIYELLDAHGDTAELAANLLADPVWEEHLDYLRALQRTGRAVLARFDEEAARRSHAGSVLDDRIGGRSDANPGSLMPLPADFAEKRTARR